MKREVTSEDMQDAAHYLTADREPVITIVIPTRNEAGNIRPLLRRLERALEDIAAEAIFVDDSADRTPQVITAEAAEVTLPVRLIARPESRRNGLSGAVVEGLRAAQGDWVCVMDADLQHPPELIPQLLEQAERAGADVVVASREADFFGPMGLSRARAITSQVLTILARLVFPRVLKNVSDPLTGFFLARRAAINAEVLQPEGFKILLEILARHPDLHVAEVHFSFAPRHEEHSKADLNEGLRFFRHLSRLRLTVNQHLIRFSLLIVLSVAANLLLLAGLVGLSNLPVLPAALIAGEVTALLILLGEMWVFSDRRPPLTGRRALSAFLISQAFVFLVYLPIVYLLAVRGGLPFMVAGILALLAAGFAYYLISDQWIWTRGLMMRPRLSYYYDVHGILALASQVPLDDLGYFQVAERPTRLDLQIRVDRHGTPSRPPGSITYDEHLGRFGFGLTVLPGDFTEIIVSPLLETSPGFLYTNVLEPVLRWLLVARGYALVRAAALGIGSGAPEPALLIAGQSDMGYGLSRLCRSEGYSFMGDDLVILGRDRRVYCYPKPVTVNRDMAREAARETAHESAGVSPGWPRFGLSLRLQKLLYSRPVRRLGLWLSNRDLPAATLNTYLQRAIPQPKYRIEALAGVEMIDQAHPSHLVILARGEQVSAPLSLEAAVELLLVHQSAAFGFQPYPLLNEQLSRRQGEDWSRKEKEIVRAALGGAAIARVAVSGNRWWEHLPAALRERRTDAVPLHAAPPLLIEPTPNS